MKKLRMNLLEWAVFAVSLVLVLATLGFLLYEAATLEDTPPSLEARLGQPERQAQRWRVPVTVRNNGGRTAEGVLVEVVLEAGGRELERAELQLAFVPRGSQREGFVTLRNDPGQAELFEARVLGYEDP